MMGDLRSVYCSGSISKGPSDEQKLCWSDKERSEVQDGCIAGPIRFLNPDDPIVQPSNFLGQFGRDMYQIMIATAVVVDARERRGLGIGVEMAAAAAMGTPVIVVAPRNSKYRADFLAYRGAEVADYVHPHVHSLTTELVATFVDAGRALSTMTPLVSRRRSVPSWLEHAIAEYEENVLKEDYPMVSAMKELGIHAGS